MPELYIKKIITKHYLTAIMTELRVSIKVKLIISIDTFYAPTESREDIETKDAQNKRRLKKLRYSQPYVFIALTELIRKNT
jgi:hypothetical protein